MRHEGQQGVRRGLPARAAVLALPGVVALLVLVPQLPVLVHRCVAGDGLAGELGLRLALLRADAVCPTGTLALGGDPGRVVGVLVVVAVPVLLLHLLTACAVAAVLAVLTPAVRRAGGLLARVVRPLPDAPTPVPGARPRPSWRTLVPVVLRDVGTGPYRRGPPVLLPA